MAGRGSKPGERRGGRVKGTPNKVSAEIRETARQLVEDEAYRAELAKRLVEGKAAHMETLLFHYAYGKPKEGEVTGNVLHTFKWQQ